MINSMCGSVGGGSVKKENSCSKLQQPTSPTASVSESNNIIALLPPVSNDFNHPNPSSLNFEGLKFEVDVDEIQSPDSSIWESLFADHIDTSTDFMISSPKMTTPDFMIMSPKRNTSLSQHISTYNQNYNYMHGQTLLGSSPPSSISTHVGAYTTIQKGKAQSPLHKVFTSTGATANDDEGKSSQDNNNNLALDRFLDDGFIGGGVTGGGGGGYPMKMEGNFSESFEMPTTLSAMLGYSPLGNSSSQQSSAARYDGGLVNDVGSMQMPQEYQINTFATQQQQQQQHNPDHGLIGAGSDQDQQDSGLQLVHLLLACAEAVAKEDYMTARKYLHHLNRVVTPLGDSMQRVASCFTDALSTRLAATLTTSPNTSTPKQPFTPFPSNSLEILKIYQIVYQACPYIKFAHFTANQAIFEAFETEERVHIIDLDIHQGYQWPAFMQALAARPGGAPFLRITGVGSPPESVRETGRCLTELAHSLHIPFEFHPVGERLEDLKSHMFHRRVGEALAVNSVNRLHRVSGNHLGNLLGIIRDQAPNIVTLVEQEASHNGPYFLGRFLEALHYYSAIFDSLDATFPMDSAERAKVEHYIFAPEIRNIVANEGPDRVERHERLEKWRKMMEGRGFKGVPLSANAVTQSKILLGLYSCDGYRLTEDRGCLLLGWQDRALIAASAWRC